jgi:predicted esterase
MNKTMTLFSVVMILFFATSVLAGIIQVPASQPTIQAGINTAANGDTVLVSHGTYYENINFKGKAITVGSHFLMDADTTHISHTIINGSSPSHPDSGSVVYFVSGEDTSSVLCGFTITGGSGTVGTEIILWTLAYAGSYQGRMGCGILVKASGGRIRDNRIKDIAVNNNENIFGVGIRADLASQNTLIIEKNEIYANSVEGQLVLGGGINIYAAGICRIVNNRITGNSITGTANVGGGAIFCKSKVDSTANIYIAGNIITDNTAISSATFYPGATFYGGGGGIYIHESSPEINNNIIARNSSTRGGALFMMYHYLTSAIQRSRPRIINNTIVENNATIAGGGLHAYSSSPFILNTIIRDNSAPEGAEIHLLNTSVDIGYSNIQGGWNGIDNIDTDPLFNDSDYHPSDLSPCIDAGNPDQVYNDPENPVTPGTALWPAMGGLRNDMGAYGGNPNVIVNIEPKENPILAKFAKRSHTFEGNTLPYRLFIPDSFDLAQQYPLILSLHGSAGAGTDNESHLVRPGQSLFGEDFVQKHCPCFVVSPQTRYNFNDTELKTVINILDSLIVEFPVDTNRIYVAGGSSGGGATWMIIRQYRDRFAAAIPMAGWGTASWANAIRHISIWAMHGINDLNVSILGSRRMITALENVGCSVVYTHCKDGEYIGMPDSLIEQAVNEGAKFFYTECQNTQHICMFEFVYHPLLYQWLFMQQKSTPYPVDINEKRDICSVNRYQLHQNYPNPFNPSTTIQYNLSKKTRVKLTIYDLLGREVAVLVNEAKPAGAHQVTFNAAKLASGVYLYRIQTGEGFVQTRKLMILK